MIGNELSGLSTKVVFIPSHKDIHHLNPLPQHAFSQKTFNNMFTQAVLASNPDVILQNEIKVGVINADIIKEMCHNMYPKNMDIPKIDLSLKSMIEQRSFYPIYPPNQELPIDYSHIDSLLMNEGTPDILITPSDLTQFVKVTLFDNLFRTSMAVFA